ncbi:hypothetical protein [Streptomyces nigrescens]
MSKAFGILADRPECYVYSPAVGCVITGVPREDVFTHYSCRGALAALRQSPELLDGSPVSKGTFRRRPRGRRRERFVSRT